MRVLRAGAAALFLGLVLAPAALAQGTLTLTTAYPAVTADPGTTAKFTVIILTDQPERVDLSVPTVPTGWSTRLRGGGATVSAVNTAPQPVASGSTTTQNEGIISVEVTVPADVAAGDNQVVLQGKLADGTTSSLTLDVTTAAAAAGDVTMTSDFPNLKGSTTTSFKYNLTLTNSTNEQLTFGFDSTAPDGWAVSAIPQGETQATTATVDAGGTTGISVSVDPPADATAGTYDIAVTATGGPAPVETDLTVEITGSYSLALSTSDNLLNTTATAGGSSTLTLIVTNTGSAPLTNVKMTVSPPRGWKVTFDQDTIASIPAGTTGNTANVVATIQPPGDAVAGDYNLTIRAGSTDETSAADSVAIRTTVNTSPIGLIIGIGILIVVAAGLFFVFQRYGRR